MWSWLTESADMRVQPSTRHNVSMDMGRAERPLLFDTPAGFDDPLAMLLGCHRRIEKQLATLSRLREHLAARGVDPEASQAAQSVLEYFVRAAPNHHHDEEIDLFPLIEARITDPGEATRFRDFRDALLKDHRELEAAWARLRKPLEGIADGLTRQLPVAEVQAFAKAYAHHIVTEESALSEFFQRWLQEADRVKLGRAMAARRGVSPAP
jgi:pyridoxamine 5'-phosphate oxidase